MLRISILLIFTATFGATFAQNPDDSVLQKTDSVLLLLKSRTDTLEKLSQRFTHISDTLNPSILLFNRRLDSIKGKLTHRIDSLKRLNLPTAQYTHLLDSLQKAGPIKDIKQAEAKLTSLERQGNQPFNQLSSTINKSGALNQKFALINKDVGAGANLSGGQANPPGNINLPNLQVPGVTQGSLPNTNLNLSPGSIPGGSNPLNQISGIPNTSLPGINSLGKTNGEINSITNAPQKELGELKKEVSLGQIQNEMGQVNGYSKDLKQLSKGNLDSMKTLNKTIEKKARQIVETKELQSGTKELEQYKSLVGKGNDPEAMKKLAMQEVQKEAVNHFAGKEKELQSAMSQITKLKQKYPSVSSLSDLKKLSRNQMHGKPLIERIVLGINFQVQVKNHLMIDFNQQVGYRWTKRLTVGAGWNERIGIQHYHITLSDRIYGPRSFVDFKLKESFSLRGEVEKMNAYVPSLSTDPGSRQWVWGVFLGIKKDYKFSKYIRGNIQTMYNFADKCYKTNPYADRLNVRIGFEFPMKKKVDLPKLADVSLSYMKVAMPFLNSGTRSKPGGIAMLSHRFDKDTVTITQGITRQRKINRKVVTTYGCYRFRYNKQTRRDEILNTRDSVLATTRHFYDITMTDGQFYDFVRVSATEWRYVCDGREIVAGNLIGIEPNTDVVISWIESPANGKELLKMMCQVYGIGLLETNKQWIRYLKE